MTNDEAKLVMTELRRFLCKSPRFLEAIDISIANGPKPESFDDAAVKRAMKVCKESGGDYDEDVVRGALAAALERP